MDLTPLIPSNHFPSAPCDLYIATVYLPSRLIVRSTNSLSIKRVIILEPAFARDVICLNWTRTDDGHRRLLIADTRSVRAYDMDDEHWEACIAENLGGVRHAEWSATGSVILIWSEFQLKMTAWSVETLRGSIVPNPKFVHRGYGERSGANSRWFAMLQRTSHDHVAILNISEPDWKVVKTFPVATSDAQGLLFSPDGAWIAIWDSAMDYTMLIYTVDGRLLRSFQAYATGLGIKTVQWAPNGEYLAIGSYDNKVRLLNTRTYTPVVELTHLGTIRSETTTTWRQVQSGPLTQYVVAHQPISPPFIKTGSTDALTKSGVGILLFSPDGSLIATRSDYMPTTLWIWSLREMLPIAILIHTNPIKTVQWHPQEVGQLVFCCQDATSNEENAIYLWNIEWNEPRIISIPRDGFIVKWFRIIENEYEKETGIVIGSADCFTIGYPCQIGSSSNDTIQEEDEEDQSQATVIQESMQNSLIVHDSPGNVFTDMKRLTITVL